MYKKARAAHRQKNFNKMQNEHICSSSILSVELVALKNIEALWLGIVHRIFAEVVADSKELTIYPSRNLQQNAHVERYERTIGYD